MRLCYIANSNSIHVRRWVRHFVGRGHEVHLISTRPGEAPIPAGIFLHSIAAPPVPRLRNLALGFAIRREVRRIQPDLVHAHQISPDGWLAAMAGYHPLLLTAWGSDLLLAPRKALRYHLLIRWALRQADYVTCVSESLAQVARSLGADPARLEVAPWGVDTEVFHPGPPNPELRRQLDLGPGPVVLSIRALRPLYNPLVIAQAIPLVLQKVPEAQFVIRSHLYEPDLLARFQVILQESGVEDRVRWVGDLSDDQAIAELYRLAEVAVSVPLSDGMPQSVLEAMACGAPPVVSDVPSLHEWIEEGREGLFVPVGDSQALSAAIVRLLRDEALRKRLQTHGLELVRQRADRVQWMAYAEAIYERLVAECPAARSRLRPLGSDTQVRS
ncbi:MAG: glycosyltransferase family 4 protein [Anaerolineae bacterium]